MAKIIIIIALIIGLYGWRGHVIWGFDQSRDAFEAANIWQKFDFKLLGPSSDIPGVNHGPLWYYFLAPVYFIFDGNPNPVSLLFLLVLFLSSIFVYKLSYKLFPNKLTAYLAVCLYLLSPLFQSYTRWMSNPMLSLFISPIILMLLWDYFEKPLKRTAFLSGLFFGLLIQSDVAFGIFLFVLPFYYWLFKQKLIFTDILSFLFGFLAGVITFILAEIKFGGRMTLGLLNFILNGPQPMSSASGALFQLFDRVIDFLSFTILPFPKLLIIILALILIRKINFSSRPTVFLLFWLSNIVIFQFFATGITGSGFVFAPSLAPLVILAANILVNYRLLVFLIFAAQTVLNLKWLNVDYSPVSVQRGVTLTAEEKVIDYTYTQSDNEPFIIITMTNPLYINTNWAYLYEFYGRKKYGSLPFWAGKSQKGYLGNLPDKIFDTKWRFLILEQSTGIPDIYVTKTIYEEDRLSDLIAEEKFAGLTVQKRLFHPNKGPIEIPEALRLAPKILAE
jgi:hypothetical protein